MTLRDTREAHVALLTAGVVMIGLGFFIATFPNGRWFGFGLATFGVGIIVAAVVLAWKDWRRPTSSPDRSRVRARDRWGDAEERLRAIAAGGASTTLIALGAALLLPEDRHWIMAGTSALLLVLTLIALVFVWWRRRAIDRRSTGH